MGKNTSVVIGEAQERFVKRQIAIGRFATTSEAVREGLALLEQRELGMEELRRAIDEGLASGDAQELDIGKWLAAKRAAS